MGRTILSSSRFKRHQMDFIALPERGNGAKKLLMAVARGPRKPAGTALGGADAPPPATPSEPARQCAENRPGPKFRNVSEPIQSFEDCCEIPTDLQGNDHEPAENGQSDRVDGRLRAEFARNRRFQGHDKLGTRLKHTASRQSPGQQAGINRFNPIRTGLIWLICGVGIPPARQPENPTLGHGPALRPTGPPLLAS